MTSAKIALVAVLASFFNTTDANDTPTELEQLRVENRRLSGENFRLKSALHELTLQKAACQARIQKSCVAMPALDVEE